MEESSVDLLVTDPPYGYSFMGKHWDKAIVSVDIWEECMRVLKPGAFGFIMSAPRQDVLSHMIVNLELAGFEVGFTSIYWTYATGFPKGMNIGKVIDKKTGSERDVIGKGNSMKSLGVMHDDNWKSNPDYKETKGYSKLEGSYAGYQPKPAVEIIITVMKPLEEKSFVDQALANNKGVTWLDDCRIPYKSERDKMYDIHQAIGGTGDIYGFKNGPGRSEELYQPHDKGRFPANLLVSDDILNNGEISKSSGGSGEKSMGNLGNNVYNKFALNVKSSSLGGYQDIGSYSRYFDLDKWFETFPFALFPKASKKERNKGLENLPDKETKRLNDRGQGSLPKQTPQSSIIEKNIHPTVKPIKLMAYLIVLGSRENDLILDPFCGSGTTCISAKLLNRNYIGIEKEDEYCDIAKARLQGFNLESEIQKADKPQKNNIFF